MRDLASGIYDKVFIIYDRNEFHIFVLWSSLKLKCGFIHVSGVLQYSSCMRALILPPGHFCNESYKTLYLESRASHL